MGKSKKLKMKKVFFGATSKATARRKKGGKIKSFFGNPYVEAVCCGFLGGASYSIAQRIFSGKTKVTMNPDRTEVEALVNADGELEDEIEYSFHNYEASIDVSAKMRRVLSPAELKELRDIKDQRELLERLKQYDLTYLYVG